MHINSADGKRSGEVVVAAVVRSSLTIPAGMRRTV
jgi:hypothetical protein